MPHGSSEGENMFRELPSWMDSLRNLREKWDGASRWYDFATAGLEVLIFRRLRFQLLKSAVGRVLEVAAGTGSNLAHSPSGTDVITVDLSPRMLLKARQRGARKVAVMDNLADP